MHRRNIWTTAFSVKFFAARAELHPGTWETRFNWEAEAEDGSDGFTQAEMDAIYAEVIAKIPAGNPRVLEIGCGDGRFGAALKAARPAVRYQGIDLIPANIETARADHPSLDFSVGNAWEYLSEAPLGWDFVVSIGCLFHCTEDHETMFRLLDAKSPKGFFILADRQQASASLLATQMPTVLSASTSVTDSYFEGARDFLSDTTLKGILTPFYVRRNATSAEAPGLLPRLRVVGTDKINSLLSRAHARVVMRDGSPAPTQFKGVESTGGLVNQIVVNKGIDPELTQRLPKRKPRRPFDISSD